MNCLTFNHDASANADLCAACEARSLSVCANLTGAGLERLAEIRETITLAAGETLAREGDPATHLYTIRSGVVRVYRLLADGRRQIIGFLYPGDMLGAGAGARHAFEAEAVEPVTACQVRAGDYAVLTHELPALEDALLDRAWVELAAARDQMLLLGRKTAEEKLASFLIDLSARDRRAGGAGEDVRLSMTRGEIADYLGLTTETVSRVTSRLKGRGLIRLMPHNTIRIVKADALKALAAGDQG